MYIDWSTIFSPADWVNQFESQIKTTPQAISLANTFNQQTGYKTHISKVTRQALQSHGLGFLIDNISNWANMDTIVISHLDTVSKYMNADPIWDIWQQGIKQAKIFTSSHQHYWVNDDLEDHTHYTPYQCATSQAQAYFVEQSKGNCLATIILPELTNTQHAPDHTNDIIQLSTSNFKQYAPNISGDILTIILHEIGHLRSRCQNEQYNIQQACHEVLEQNSIKISHEDILDDLQNAMYLRHEVEADFYALQMLEQLENNGVIDKDPVHRHAMLGHRALDAVAGGTEHMTSVAINSTTLRPRVNLLGFQEAANELYGEYKKRGLLEIDDNNDYVVAQNAELYQNIKDIHLSGIFKSDPYVTVLLDQFLAAAKAFAPQYFEAAPKPTRKSIHDFITTLDYKF